MLRSLRACIFYLYTGKINFLPLKSEGASQRTFGMLTAGDFAPPPCSPKSMYRVAESVRISRTEHRRPSSLLVARLVWDVRAPRLGLQRNRLASKPKEHRGGGVFQLLCQVSHHASDPAMVAQRPSVSQRIHEELQIRPLARTRRLVPLPTILGSCHPGRAPGSDRAHRLGGHAPCGWGPSIAARSASSSFWSTSGPTTVGYGC